jgi:hypothetical protein
MIELPQGKILNKPPRLPPIVADCDTSIVAIDHEIAVEWLDPKCVMIRVHTVTRRDVCE